MSPANPNTSNINVKKSRSRRETRSIQISNYDVLLAAASFRLADSVAHVGNKRFEVFLNIRRDAYRSAYSAHQQDECERIVEDIVDIVCHKCVPQGRFLEERSNNSKAASSSSSWRLLSETEATRRVHQALQSMASSASRTETPFAVNQGEDTSSTTSIPTLDMMDESSFSTAATALNDDDTTNSKRQRRGSRRSSKNPPPPFLWRSMSDSLVANGPTTGTTEEADAPFQMKKQFLRQPPNGWLLPPPRHYPTLQTDTTSMSLPVISSSAKQDDNSMVLSRANSAPIVGSTTNPSASPCMDVVFCRGAKALTTSNHVGNNRFRVLMDMHARSYALTSTEKEKQAIIQDIVQTVQQHWFGQFRVEDETMEQPLVHSAVDYLLSHHENSSSSSHEMDASTAPTSTEATPVTAASTTTTTASSSSSRHHTIDVETSVKALHSEVVEGGVMPSDMTKLRSDAIRSLKARQEKKEISKRIGQGRQPNYNSSWPSNMY